MSRIFCSLFNDAYSAESIGPVGRMIDALEGNDRGLTEVLSRNVPGANEETHEHLSQDSRCSWLRFEPSTCRIQV
jgi:hypothetical protein